jgi:tRNA (cytidine/uridine-2'-O-)-methyltransferase
MRIALYQPDIPQNAGAILRLAACLNFEVDIIEPCGFVLDDARMRRSHMDYDKAITYQRHVSWAEFLNNRQPGRIVLATTKAAAPYHNVEYLSDDTFLFGQESAGVPDQVSRAADFAVRIPISDACRSLNVSSAAAILASEARRQIMVRGNER